MPFFQSVLFYATVAGVTYAGMQVEMVNASLVTALVPLLFLLVTVDVQHFLTLGSIDIGQAMFAIMRRATISLPDNYSGRVSRGMKCKGSI